MYSEKVLDHFRRPRNQGRLKNPDAVGQTGNPVCGDIMKLYLKVGEGSRGKEVIEDIKFETLGCGAAIAASSILTELVKGKTFSEALKVSESKIVSELDGLPRLKVHCSVLAAEALKLAIQDYRSEKK